VNAFFGTEEASILDFVFKVLFASEIILVLLSIELPGSLNAICPFSPSPKTQKSTLFFKIFLSYNLQSFKGFFEAVLNV